MNISSINNSTAFSKPMFRADKPIQEVLESRRKHFDTTNDTVETLRNKVMAHERRVAAEHDYYKECLKDDFRMREALRIKPTLDRMMMELKYFRREFVKKLGKI